MDQPVTQRAAHREVQEGPPAGVVRVVVRPGGSRTKPQVPIHGLGNGLSRQSVWRNIQLAAADSARPRMHLANLSDFARPENLARRFRALVAEALVAHL